MANVVEAVVDGGKANAGPLAPTLGPLGVNMGQIVADINEKTKEFNGMKVPVKVTVEDNKSYTIKVGTPPASALIKDKVGIKSGSGSAKKEFVGDIDFDKLKSIARMKWDDLAGASMKTKVNEIVGTCTSMGVTVNGVNPREMSKQIIAGQHDAALAE